jgi:hypothetical protein
MKSTRAGRIFSISGELYQHRSKKDISKNFFTNRIINTWNSLLENVISAKDTKIFEHRLDNYWKDQDLLYTITNPTSPQPEKKLKLMMRRN